MYCAPRGDMFVIKGPTFTRESERIGPHGVKVPNYLYKLVYHTTTAPPGRTGRP